MSKKAPAKAGKKPGTATSTKSSGATNKQSAAAKVGPSSFEIEGILSRDLISIVYKATSKKTGKLFAIKQIQKEFITAAKISQKWFCKVKHPGIASWTKHYMDNSLVHLVSSFCEFGSLSDVINTIKRPLTELEIAAVLRSVTSALIAAHSQGIIHGDLKASNILMASGGSIKIGDFMIRNWIKPPTKYWHAHWAAPESLEDGPVDPKSDIWSLGILAMELMNGKQPYHEFGDMVAKMQIARGNYPTAPETASPEFKEFMSKVLVEAPKKRPSAEELMSDSFINKVDDQSAKGILAVLVLACMNGSKRQINEFEYDDEEEEEEEFDEEDQ